MTNPRSELFPLPNEVIDKLIEWANSRSNVRALILTSSRARPAGPVDALSDYDVIVAVTDAKGFSTDDEWVAQFDQAMVRWRDQADQCGFATYFSWETTYVAKNLWRGELMPAR